jgi:Domain of unknown function (DUF4258)
MNSVFSSFCRQAENHILNSYQNVQEVAVMKLVQQLQALLYQDTKKPQLPPFSLDGPSRDPNHAQRRMQQRAISEEMIAVALLYGREEYHTHAKTFTILDKTLKNTPYSKFVDKLRGLRVIAIETAEGLNVTSVYWAWDLR